MAGGSGNMALSSLFPGMGQLGLTGNAPFEIRGPLARNQYSGFSGGTPAQGDGWNLAGSIQSSDPGALTAIKAPGFTPAGVSRNNDPMMHRAMMRRRAPMMRRRFPVADPAQYMGRMRY